MTRQTLQGLRATRAASLLGGLASLAAFAAQAQQGIGHQPPGLPPPQGVLVLNAQASKEVPKDWMTLVLQVSKEGSDAQLVQSQLKQAVDAALVEVRKRASPGQVEVSGGDFSVGPRYSNKGVLNGWQGSTELRIEGRDMATIAQLSGKISSMSIASVQYSIARDTREKLESEVTVQAIARFKTMAGLQAQAFGYSGFVVREVQVNYEQAQPMPMAMMDAARSMAKEAAPLAVEAGKGSLTATVSGSVQMTR